MKKESNSTDPVTEREAPKRKEQQTLKSIPEPEPMKDQGQPAWRNVKEE